MVWADNGWQVPGILWLENLLARSAATRATGTVRYQGLWHQGRPEILTVTNNDSIIHHQGKSSRYRLNNDFFGEPGKRIGQGLRAARHRTTLLPLYPQ
jgi:hypothetical protein